MRKKKNNRSYKFTEKKKSVRGMIACVGAVISLLILAGMLIQAVTSAGNGGAFLGSAGKRHLPLHSIYGSRIVGGCDSAVVSTLHVRNFVIKEKTKWITNG